MKQNRFTQKRNKRNLKKMIMAFSLCLAVAFASGVAPVVESFADAEAEKTIVTLGADLSQEQKTTVLNLLGLTEEDLAECDVLSITNQDEHDYLDAYLSADVIGKRALSSIRLDKSEEGSGIQVETNNINYCTKEMYINSLATAGVEDAKVIVAGPFPISGTAALVGTVKAYEQLTGEEVDEDVMDAATDELVTTGELSESIGSAEQASELMGFVKKEVVEQDLTNPEAIQEVVEEAAKEMEIQLTDEDVDKIVATMTKISKLDLDIDSIKQQAQNLYDKLDSLNIDLDEAQGLFDKFLAFFKNIYYKIVNLFQ